MILETQVEEKREELVALREDAEALNLELVHAVASAEDSDLIKELQSKKKTLMTYIQDLTDELAGMQIGEPDGENENPEHQGGSFEHALLHSTIIEDETGTPEEGGEEDSLSPEGWPDWDRPQEGGEVAAPVLPASSETNIENTEISE